MKFLVDAQLPPALADYLISAGHEAEHVTVAGLGRAEDGRIWEYAMASGCVLVSKDDDFASRRALENVGPAVVWLRIGNCSNPALLRWFVPLVPDLISRLAAGEVLVEIT